MQDPPDKRLLLEAVSRLLSAEVVPALSDPALAFRVRIAAHVLSGISRELLTEDEDDQHHLETLAALGFAGSTPAQADQALAAHIRDAPLPDDELVRLAGVLRELTGRKIRVNNPRFER